jgi:hypothetical protein
MRAQQMLGGEWMVSFTQIDIGVFLENLSGKSSFIKI